MGNYGDLRILNLNDKKPIRTKHFRSKTANIAKNGKQLPSSCQNGAYYDAIMRLCLQEPEEFDATVNALGGHRAASKQLSLPKNLLLNASPLPPRIPPPPCTPRPSPTPSPTTYKLSLPDLLESHHQPPPSYEQVQMTDMLAPSDDPRRRYGTSLYKPRARPRPRPSHLALTPVSQLYPIDSPPYQLGAGMQQPVSVPIRRRAASPPNKLASVVVPKRHDQSSPQGRL